MKIIIFVSWQHMYIFFRILLLKVTLKSKTQRHSQVPFFTSLIARRSFIVWLRFGRHSGRHQTSDFRQDNFAHNKLFSTLQLWRVGTEGDTNVWENGARLLFFMNQVFWFLGNKRDEAFVVLCVSKPKFCDNVDQSAVATDGLFNPKWLGNAMKSRN